MHDVGVEKGKITADLASRLIAEQFPQWSHLAVTPVELDGWDNTTFRLGDDLSVRHSWTLLRTRPSRSHGEAVTRTTLPETARTDGPFAL